MDLEEMKLEEIVEYINKELVKGRTLKDIETIDFKVNDRVIAKRLSRKGYKRIDNQYLYKSDTTVLTKEPYNRNLALKEDNTNILPMYNQLDLNKLNELISLINPIKEVIQEYNKSKIL
ncbi:hypothetical protein [Clostridium sp.]|uniref:hypothetical protein n=1 Tax=Clostridium sp. TaxID=1506 RepID=UPI00260771E5|nr:hypothetical protein [Clostridium sp.]